MINGKNCLLVGCNITITPLLTSIKDLQENNSWRLYEP